MTSAQAPSIKVKFSEAAQLLREQGLLVAASALTPKNIELEITTDSRKVSPKHIFLAYLGTASDGHKFIATADSSGVAAIICEDTTHIDLKSTTPWLQVSSGRAAWAWLASLAYGHPQKNLQLIGVTGTNGKTSTVWYCRQLLAQFGLPSVAIGTLGIWIGDEFTPSPHTTPDPPQLFATLAKAVRAGIKVVAMECSSHSVVQHKIEPLKFDALAFTSFTRDHLDLHKTMDDYFQAKWKLFTYFAKPNARMAFSSALPDKPEVAKLRSHDVWCYGLNGKAKAKAWSINQFLQVDVGEMSARQCKFKFSTAQETYGGQAALPADYATENLAAATLLVEKIVGKKVSERFLAKVTPPPGRMQVVSHAKGPVVVVDYAHTPDALEKTLQGARLICSGKLFVVFGCGGDRDKGKRPQMGKIAEDLADFVVVTSDNPRSEKPQAILDDILAGISDQKRTHHEVDRGAGISYAIKKASVGDLIVIAGKGHENYQIIGKETLHFDDSEVAKKALQDLWP